MTAATCQCQRCRCVTVIPDAWDASGEKPRAELLRIVNGAMERQAEVCLPEGCPCHTGHGEMPAVDIELEVQL
jgi:hypothetical protein